MQFETIYEVTQPNFTEWGFVGIGLLFIAIGGLLVFAPDLMQRVLPGGLQGRGRRIFSWVFLSFATFWTIIAVAGFNVRDSWLRNAFSTGRYRTVAGVIRNFHPMPYTGHAIETFDVEGAHFEYSDYVMSGGFHQTSSHGGPIREGLYVRISYVGNVIVKLEIGR
jgi:hypothetical protein